MFVRSMFAALFVAAQVVNPSSSAQAANPIRLAFHSDTSPESYKDIVYLAPGGYELQLDVYVNRQASKPAPVLIYFHGGAWARGSRPGSWRAFRKYLSAGFSVVTVDYRLAGVALAPAAVQDVRCSLSWVEENAARFGFDRERIVVFGTSAGGHLALMAAMVPSDNDIDLPECRDVPRAAAVLDFYGPTALALLGENGEVHPTVLRWIGEGPHTDAMITKMSPTTYVRSDLPPIFIGHGDADPTVPIEQSLELKRRLDAANAPNELHIVPGGLHGNFTTEQQQALDRAVFAFLKRFGLIN